MQVTKEPLEPCQVALTIEVEPDKVAGAVDRAYREYAKHVTVPGFRKGKAPMNFVRPRIPESDIRQRTAELLIDPAYRDALSQESIEPFAQPRLELVQLELAGKPFVFKALVPLAPQVELAEYVGLTAERKVYTVSDADIDAQIERMRERAADYPQVERAAQKGDLLLAEVTAETDLRPEAAEPRQTMIEVGAEGNIPGFDEQIIGLNVGDTKTFELTYPAEFPEADLAGQPVTFTISVKEVRERQLPALDDELAKKLTSGRTETLDGLKADLRAELEKNLKASAEQEVQAGLIDKLIDASVVKFPPVMTEQEVNAEGNALLQQLQQQNVTLEDYLGRIGKTQEGLVADLHEQAVRRIEIGLTLGELAKKESLEVTDEDVEAEIVDQAAQNRTTPAAIRAYLTANNGLDAVRNRAQTKKVLDFLVAKSVIADNPVNFGEEIAAETAQVAGEAETKAEATVEAEAAPVVEAKPVKTRKKAEPKAEEAPAAEGEAEAKKPARKKTTKKQDADATKESDTE